LPRTGDEPHLLKTDLGIDKLSHTSWPQLESMPTGVVDLRQVSANSLQVQVYKCRLTGLIRPVNKYKEDPAVTANCGVSVHQAPRRLPRHG